MISFIRMAISLAMLAWWTEPRLGVFLGAPLDFVGTDYGFLESITFNNLANDIQPAVATFVTEVRSSATDSIVFCESCERLDMVRFKKYD